MPETVRTPHSSDGPETARGAPKRPCDTCDTLLTKAIVPAPTEPPAFSEKQRRFLDAYRERVSIAPAARLAGVHRATVHRWRADPSFAAAMKVAADAYFAAHRAKVLTQEAEREVWREQRNRELKPQRQATIHQSINSRYGWGS